jgi:2-phosphosulfolactate phosphatase
MKLQIHMSPAAALATRLAVEDIYIVIDVIRATTSITTIFDSGAKRILIADTIEQARKAAQFLPGRLLCGERDAKPLPDFDFGNSPAEFARTQLNGRELILTTTNGTRAFFACPEQSVRLAGCFYNASAVTAYALARAQTQNSNIAIICAAESGSFALDDTTCAGYLAQEIQRQQPDIQCHESVLAASTLYQLYAPPKLIPYCHSIQHVLQAGLGEDIALCLQQNVSTSIGKVTRREAETDLWILESVSHLA